MERQEQLERRAKEMEERQKRLDEAVEGYSIRPQVEADENRVVQDTKARQLRKGVELDKADKVKLWKNHGYTIDNLMKDIRFKINAVLSEAGLERTTYGQHVLKGITPGSNYSTAALKSNTKGLL